MHHTKMLKVRDSQNGTIAKVHLREIGALDTCKAKVNCNQKERVQCGCVEIALR